jgi:hypothetical protein
MMIFDGAFLMGVAAVLGSIAGIIRALKGS